MEKEHFNPTETMSRKEYVKMKKREKKKYRRVKTKPSTILLSGVFLFLSIYVCVQLSIYAKGRNLKYTAGEGINEKVYGAYYVVPSYTYNTSYSVSYVETDGDNDELILQNTAFKNIVVDDTHIYGIRQGILYRLNKLTLNIEEIASGNVNKFIKLKDKLYFVTGSEKDGGKLESVNLDGTGRKIIYKKYVFQIVGDDDGIYVIANEKSARNIVKIGIDGTSKVVLVKTSSSNIIVKDDYLYYANKSDKNRLYKASKKTPNSAVKLTSHSVVADTGPVKSVNGNKLMFIKDGFIYYINVTKDYKLYKMDLSGKNVECVLDVKMDTVTLKGDIIFYMSKNEMGFCSYNLKTGLMKQISNKRISEFTIVESSEDTEK